MNRKRSEWQMLEDEVLRQYAAFDRQLQHWVADYTTDGGRIYCGRGCSNCCSLAVNASFAEALLVAKTLTRAQAAALDAHVADLLKHIDGVADLKSYLRLQRTVIGDCPFLEDDGGCGVYGVRPFSCRALLATRPADWCAVDFAELSELDKRLFMSSLDQNVVAFPVHYVAATQESGRELESHLVRMTAETFGVSLHGNLPYLVYLERRYAMHEVFKKGERAVAELLEGQNLLRPFVLEVEAVEDSSS